MNHEIRQPSVRAAALGLGTLAALVVAAVLIVGLLSQDRIATAQADLHKQRLVEILPDLPLDPPQANDTIEQADTVFDSDAPLPVQRFWQAGAPAAAVMQVLAPDGYNGDIVLLVGVTTKGVISGVRVASHRETPGLGDAIERRRSEWITGFTDLSLDNTPEAAWTVVQRGGKFDAFTGATITPQAVVQAVHRALRWYDRHSSLLFSLPR